MKKYIEARLIKLYCIIALSAFIANCSNNRDDSVAQTAIKLSINTLDASALAIYQSSTTDTDTVTASAENDNSNNGEDNGLKKGLKKGDLVKYNDKNEVEPVFNLDVVVYGYQAGKKADDYILISGIFADILEDVEGESVNLNIKKCTLIAVAKNKDNQKGYCLDFSDDLELFNQELRKTLPHSDQPIYAFNNEATQTTNYLFISKNNGLSEFKVWDGTATQDSITIIYQTSNEVFAADKLDTLYVYAKNNNYFFLASAVVAGSSATRVIYGNSVDGWNTGNALIDSAKFGQQLKPYANRLGDYIFYHSDVGDYEAYWYKYDIDNNILTAHDSVQAWSTAIIAGTPPASYMTFYYVEEAGAFFMHNDGNRETCRTGIIPNNTIYPNKDVHWNNAENTAIYYISGVAGKVRKDICKITIEGINTVLHTTFINDAAYTAAWETFDGQYKYGVHYRNADNTINKVFILGAQNNIETIHVLDLITNALDESVNILTSLEFTEVSNFYLDNNNVLVIEGTGSNGLLKTAFYDPKTLAVVIEPVKSVLTSTPVLIN